MAECAPGEASGASATSRLAAGGGRGDDGGGGGARHARRGACPRSLAVESLLERCGGAAAPAPRARRPACAPRTHPAGRRRRRLTRPRGAAAPATDDRRRARRAAADDLSAWADEMRRQHASRAALLATLPTTSAAVRHQGWLSRCTFGGEPERPLYCRLVSLEGGDGTDDDGTDAVLLECCSLAADGVTWVQMPAMDVRSAAESADAGRRTALRAPVSLLSMLACCAPLLTRDARPPGGSGGTTRLELASAGARIARPAHGTTGRQRGGQPSRVARCARLGGCPVSRRSRASAGAATSPRVAREQGEQQRRRREQHAAAAHATASERSDPGQCQDLTNQMTLPRQATRR